MKIIKIIFCIVLGAGTGSIISGAVFAFIAMIGVVPRFAIKTNTTKYINSYETAILIGGIFGAIYLIQDFQIKLPLVFVIFLSFCNGVFFGCLSVALAEVLDVIPVLSRRLNIKKSIGFLLISLSIGKLIGSLLYFLVPGFYILTQ